MQTGQGRATWGTVLGVVGLLIFGWLVAVGFTSDGATAGSTASTT